MTPTREDLELYVTGNFDGDGAALERAIAEDPAVAAIVADEARLELLLRAGGAAATFCASCDELVRDERCDSCGAAVRPGGYIVERVLVSNAHGRMYVAHDADGKQVALKELAFVQSPTPAAIAAFEREAKFLRALEHPAIPRFLASFEEGRGVHTRYYLAQELVAGKSLDRLDDHWYSETEIVDIARQVLQILVYLQSLSPMVIHRDIKPANLVRREDGSIALVDFGAAYVDGTTAGLTTVGTFGYMPIEQLAGIVDATTDVFALGASLLYLLTRQEPWRLAQTKPTINVSPRLRAYLDKLVAPDPRDRFASAAEALAALDKPDAIVPRRRRRWRRPLTISAAAVAVMIAGGGTFAYVHHHREPVAVPQELATLRLSLKPGVGAKLELDGRFFGIVANGYSVPITPGVHAVKVVIDDDRTCFEPKVSFWSGKTVTLECAGTPPPVQSRPRLHADKIVSWSFKDTKLHDALMTAATTCGLSIVVPGTLDAKVTADLTNVPCDQALEVLLESHGLWYEYRPELKLLRVGARKDLDDEVKTVYIPRGEIPELPTGKLIDVDFKRVPLRDALRLIAGAGEAGAMNIVVPEGIDGTVTFRLKSVPWRVAFEAVLASHGLGYRYRENGKLIRVATLKDLEAEDAR